MRKLSVIFIVSLLFLGASAWSFDGLGFYGKLTVGYQRSSAKADVDYYLYDYIGTDGEVFKRKYSASESVNTSGFEVLPAFGVVLPFSSELSFGSFSYALEASVGLTFGGTDDIWLCKTTSTVIAPGLNFILDYHFPTDFPEALQKLVPYAGAGFAVPISIIKTEFKGNWGLATSDSTDTYAAFRANFLTGAHYDFAEKFGAIVEFNMGFSSYFAFSSRIGIMYRFK